MTATDILFRGLQVHWDELFPTADERALKAANEYFNLPAASPDELADFIKSKWDMISKDQKGNGKDKDADVRGVFSMILDRAVGIEIEGKVDDAFAAM